MGMEFPKTALEADDSYRVEIGGPESVNAIPGRPEGGFFLAGSARL